ncbi:DegT/DnrJ/EryC1/StrS family aminotransferase [Chloroflexota bacterium]
MTSPSFNYYTIRLNGSLLNRNKLREYLESAGVQTMVYYPVSLHLQEAYRYLGYGKGDFPESEQAQEEVISLPMYPELSVEQIREVATGIEAFVKSR